VREVGTFEAKTHLSALLDEVARGETIIITKRGRAVARLTPPEAPNRGAAVSAAGTLRSLRKRIGWASTEEILQMRDEGRR
jgi:prevent-host-death family protein